MDKLLVSYFYSNGLGEMAAPGVEQSMLNVPIIWRTNTQL